MCEFTAVINEKKVDCCFYNKNAIEKNILLDDQNLCVFHSKNKAWKNENNFVNHLEKLTSYFEDNNNENIIFLDNIIFTENVENLFSNREFQKNISLKYAEFKEGLLIRKSIFKELNFDSAIFNKTVSFLDITVREITLNNTHFKSKVLFEELQIKDNFFMLDSNLNGGLSISNAIFNSNSFFERLKTNLDSSIRQGITFKNIQFKGFTTFELSEFNALTDFKNITVNNELLFYNAQFNYNEPIPRVSSVTFKQIQVNENGRIEFKGSSDTKMFSKVQDISFINENIDGKLFFENTDFTKFNLSTRERLINATKEKNSKIIIGKGCIKYYNQTPLKSIEIDDDNKNLAIELCNTFVDYFTNNGGFNLGVEFVNKTEKHLNFFYFSDEIISYEEFLTKLQKSELQMWRLIKVEKDNLNPNQIKNNIPAKIINATDTMINLFSLVLKIGSRIPLGLISKNEISSLLNTTITMDSPNVNNLVVNQIVLFGINNTQSFQVKKLG